MPRSKQVPSEISYLEKYITIFTKCSKTLLCCIFLSVTIITISPFIAKQNASAKNPPAQTPSGTQPATPAQPAVPGAQPATPATPAQPAVSGTPATPATPGNFATPAGPGIPDTPVSPVTPSVPVSPVTPVPSAPSPALPPPIPSAPPLPPVSPVGDAGKGAQDAIKGVGGGILGAILPGKSDKNDKKSQPESKKTEKPESKALPIKTTTQIEAKNLNKLSTAQIETKELKSSLTQQTQGQLIAPLFFGNKTGPKIAVFDFDGNYGKEFSDSIAQLLATDFQIYNRDELLKKGIIPEEINRISGRKIASELGIDYLLYGKINKKSEKLYTVSVFLREGKTGDVKSTEFDNFRKQDELKLTAGKIVEKVKNRIKSLN